MLSTSISLSMRTLIVLSLVIPILLQVCILWALFQRKLERRFRWFSIYIFYELVETIARLSVSAHFDQYLAVYWLSAIGGISLTLLSVWESFLGIFWLETKQNWFQWLFWGCVGFVLAYSGLRAWIDPPLAPTRLGAVLLDIEIGVQYLIAALGLLYFGLVRFFKVVGHQRESSIIWGFGANATITVLGILLRSVFVTRLTLLGSWLPAIGYIIAEIAWTRGLLRQEQKVPEPEISLDEVRFAMGKYTDFLYRYLGRER